MPTFSDENGRYWWAPPGESWMNEVEIPHPPVTKQKGCRCAMCSWRPVLSHWGRIKGEMIRPSRRTRAAARRSE